MIYVDTSVLLAALFAEDKRPQAAFWSQTLVSSRLLDYEAWTRTLGRGLESTHGEALRQFLERLNYVELSSAALRRVREPFPMPVRTLDAIHLATADYLVQTGIRNLQVASYDERMLQGARHGSYCTVASRINQEND